MEEISFKGENYVKASVLARKYGYTADYVGQLCRSDQVKATLVGRSWYVNEESLLEHRKGRYRSTLAKSKEMVRKLAEERVVHQPKPMNVKRIVRYENDEEDLLPTLREKEVVADRVEETELVEEDVSPESKEVSFDADIPEEETVTEPETYSVPITRHRRPPVRTIPAYAPLDIAPRPSTNYPPRRERPSTPVRTGGRSLVPALLLMFLLTEVLLVSAALGLEKRLVATADDQAAVTYDFNPELLVASVASVWNR